MGTNVRIAILLLLATANHAGAITVHHHWEFGDGASPGSDSVGSAHFSTVGSTLDVPGSPKSATSQHFANMASESTAANYMTYGGSLNAALGAAGNHWGLEVWARTLSHGGDPLPAEIGILHLGGTSQPSLAIEVLGDEWAILRPGAGTTTLGKAALGEWTHFVCLGTGQVYVDGVLFRDGSPGTMSFPILPSDSPNLTVGAMGADNRRGFEGQIDDFRLFTFDPGSFAITQTLVEQKWVRLRPNFDGITPHDGYGASVAFSADGSRLAIGATGNSSLANDNDNGRIEVYELKDRSWVQIGADIHGEASGDSAGASIALSADGTHLAVGAPGNDGNGFAAGHARVYREANGSWIQLGADIDAEERDDRSGTSVALSADGMRLAVGAPRNDGNDTSSGHVRVHQFNGVSWTRLGSSIDGEARLDNSGTAIALSGDGTRLAIGAPNNDGNGDRSGHVRVYRLVGTSWIQLGADIDGEAENDASGSAVAISTDGSTLAIGAASNDGNGTDSGHVRVYRLTGDQWVQMGPDIDGEAEGDLFGTAVALSADGSRLAVGAILNDDGRDGAGHARIFDFVGGNWIQVGRDIDGQASGVLSGQGLALSSDGAWLAIGATGAFGQVTGQVRTFAGVFGKTPPPVLDFPRITAIEAAPTTIDIAWNAFGTRNRYAVECSLDGTSWTVVPGFDNLAFTFASIPRAVLNDHFLLRVREN